jgi:peptidoglycan/LPS O-acetylase OafA/YrhL
VLSTDKVYFPGLNGLRFFAALAVIFTHVELMKKFTGHDNLWINSGARISTYAGEHIANGEMHWASPLIAEAGPLGVIFFFVLSGFLITYLLLVEKKQTQTIGIGAFYLRRIYRIWPLYFLVFVLGFFVLPNSELFYVRNQTESLHDNFMPNFWCYLFFLPNLAYSMFMAVPNIGQSWSVGVEEQFYLVWPVIMKRFRKTLRALLVVTAILLAIKAMVLFIGKSYPSVGLTVLQKFLAMSKIECMTLGGIGAYLIFTNQLKWLKLIYSIPMQLAAYTGIPLLLYFSPALLQDGIHLVYGLCFLIIILNVSGNPSSLLRLENKWFHFLGKISYGIYMYHLMCVVFVLHFLDRLFQFDRQLTVIENISVYSLSIGLTILISYLSYEFFEKRFIRMKRSVTRVISGDEARILP